MQNRLSQRWGVWMVLMIFCSLNVSAQVPDSTTLILAPVSVEELNAAHRKQQNPHGIVYAKATALGDHATAIVALHYLLEADPLNPFLQDSLAGLYHRVGNHVACHRWCLEILQSRPDARYILQLAAEIEEGRGDFVAALEHLSHLQKIAGSHYLRYKIAGLQFQLGRYGECGANVEAMLTDAGIDAESLFVAWEGGGGPVTMRAALLNLRGNLELALGKEALARKSFREALKLAPDFGLARNNLSALQAKHQSVHEGGGN